MQRLANLQLQESWTEQRLLTFSISMGRCIRARARGEEQVGSRRPEFELDQRSSSA